MSTFNAFFIRANEKATIASVGSGFDKMEIEQYRDFIGVQLPGSLSKTPEPMLTRLSEMFSTDVIWLSFQGAMDCFEFHHWQSGRHVRSLVYGMEEERAWERADGTPEAWEREFLFHPKNMECELEDAEDDEQQVLIRGVYRDAKIEVGQLVPGISSEETADAVAHHYGFPFFNLS
jgi:hypothetical protein